MKRGLVLCAVVALMACEDDSAPRERPDAAAQSDASKDAQSPSGDASASDPCVQATNKLLDWCDVDPSAMMMAAASDDDMDAGSSDASVETIECTGPVACVAQCTLEAACEEILNPAMPDNAYVACASACTQ